MEEEVLPEESLTRIGAEDEVFGLAQEFVAVHLERAEVPAKRIRPRLRHHLAVAGIRMAREPGRERASTGRRPLERDKHVRHLARVVTLIQHVLEAQLIGLRLRVAAVLEKQDAQAAAQEPAELRHRGREDAADAEAEVGQLRAAHLLHAVAGGDVADLVAQYRRHLGFAVHVGEDAAGDEHRTARQREGVDGRIVHHMELPRDVGPLGAARHFHPDSRYVCLQGGVVHQPDARLDLFSVLLAHLDFLRLRHQCQFGTSSHGVGCAAGHQHQCDSYRADLHGASGSEGVPEDTRSPRCRKLRPVD